MPIHVWHVHKLQQQHAISTYILTEYKCLQQHERLLDFNCYRYTVRYLQNHYHTLDKTNNISKHLYWWCRTRKIHGCKELGCCWFHGDTVDFVGENYLISLGRVISNAGCQYRSKSKQIFVLF